MKKSVILLLAFLSLHVSSQAQYGYRRFRRRPPADGYEQRLPKFEPSINLSFGYAYPNLDRYELLTFHNFYQGSVMQSGPIYGAIDYHFRRTSSFGVMVSYGKVSAPYYSINTPSSAPPEFTGRLKDVSIMLNFVRYIPASEKFEPYLRTAIGVNIWSQSYLDPAGNTRITADNPDMLAYQVSLGAKFLLSKNGGLFVEAGYGKYIVSGGLTFKF